MLYRRILLCLLALCLGARALPAADRLHQSFDFDWKFTLTAPAGAETPGCDDAAWTPVQLPHDWSMTLP